MIDITSDELNLSEAHVQGLLQFLQDNYPHFIHKDLFGMFNMEDDEFAKYIAKVTEELKANGYFSDHIEQLLICRQMIAGYKEYLGGLAVSYMKRFKTEENRAKRELGIIALGGDTITAGKEIAKKAAPQVMSLAVEYEITYKRIYAFMDSLNIRNDELNQRISYLKQQKGFKNFVDG